MPVRYELKLSKVGNSLRVTIPKPVADGLAWRDGDTLILIVTDEQIKIVKRMERAR